MSLIRDLVSASLGGALVSHSTCQFAKASFEDGVEIAKADTESAVSSSRVMKVET